MILRAESESRPQPPSRAQRIAELFDALASILFHLGLLALLAPFAFVALIVLIGLLQ